MGRKVIVFVLVAGMWIGGSGMGWGQEVLYTLEDRDRLIRVEATLEEMKRGIDQRFEQLDKRFEQLDRRFEQLDRRFEQVDRRFEQMLEFMWILASVFGGLVVATIGITVWDRRTALAPALRRTGAVEERAERIERALREVAQQDPRMAEALKHAGLL
ncbi:MAG: hypothetical protein AB1671_10595 [Thermodesulfobacteriota bacterium]